MMNKVYMGVLIILTGLLLSCKSNSSGDEGDGEPARVMTPVTITHIKSAAMSDDITLNAVSTFQKKSIIKSTANGYITKALINPGQTVHEGQLLFVLKTKEAQALGTQTMDTSLGFSGVIQIRASQNGYISQLGHGQGDYIIDGEQLCVIADLGSFAFMLEVPFEVSPYVKVGHSCDILLSDKQHITGHIASKIPAVNPTTQTQQFIVKVNPRYHLPENLVAKVSVSRSVDTHAAVLPKTALLTDESQRDYWVMKMINDSTAVKVPVREGLESDTTVQIISPKFSPTDSILISGNYGLSDTALVRVVK
jgi:hypothetical protein